MQNLQAQFHFDKKRVSSTADMPKSNWSIILDLEVWQMRGSDCRLHVIMDDGCGACEDEYYLYGGKCISLKFLMDYFLVGFHLGMGFYKVEIIFNNFSTSRMGFENDWTKENEWKFLLFYIFYEFMIVVFFAHEINRLS